MGQAFPPAPPGTAEPQTHEILINFSFTEGTKPLEEEPEAPTHERDEGKIRETMEERRMEPDERCT